MPATFSRVKVWAGTEDLLTADLNAEFDNILNNLSPAGMDDYSTNVTQMRIQTSPGAQGSESLATSLSGELERLRFVVSRIIGETYWYDAPDITLRDANNLIAQFGGVPDNRIVSGRQRTGSSQPIFLVPTGSAPSVRLDGTPTPFVYRIAGSEYTISSDVTLAGLSLAPSSNNTALVNDATLTGQAASKYAGEFDSDFPTITIDTVGSEITARVGQYAAFKKGSEVFFAFVASATTLTKAYRGFFFDSTDLPIIRETLADNDSLTLLRLTWVFATTAGALDVVYNTPAVAFDQPSSPSPGDYWFDLGTDIWKKYNGSSFVDAAAILVGVCVQDTANCIAARSYDLYGSISNENTVVPEFVTVNQVRSEMIGARISVYGNVISFGRDLQEWDMPGDLASGESELSSTDYFIYVTQSGDTLLSSERPFDRSYDLGGYYHPYHTWRCVGQITNDGASAFTASSLRTYGSVNSAALRDQAVRTRAIKDLNVTFGKRELRAGVPTPATLGQILITPTAANFSVPAGTGFNTVPGLGGTITTNGGVVVVQLTSGGDYGGGDGGINSNTADAQVRCLRDGVTVVGVTRCGVDINGYQSAGSIVFFDVVAAGTYAYVIQGAVVAAQAMVFRGVRFTVREV